MGERCFDVSVIIPTFNRSALVSRAIESVLAQTYPVNEIIVVDDGSTDDTEQVIRKYENGVRYIRQENAGVSAARNRGIKAATGEWIAFLDSDDEWLPNLVGTHEQALSNHPDCKWSFCNFQFAGGSVQQSTTVEKAVSFKGVVGYFDALMRGIRFPTAGFLIHRSVFDIVGKFNPGMRTGEDIDLCARIAMRYPRIAYSPEICYLVLRDNLDSLMKADYPRDPVLDSLCENVRLSQSIGNHAFEAYYPYGRMLSVSYILRAAARRVSIGREALDKARTTFPLSLRERVLEATLKALPAPIAAKVVGRFVY